MAARGGLREDSRRRRVPASRLARAVCAAAAFALVAAACRSPATEVLVEFDTDVDPARAMTIHVRVIDGAGLEGGSEQMWVRGGASGTITTPASFAVVPADAAHNGSVVTVVFDAQVEGVGGAAPIAFRRVVRFALTPHVAARVPVFLTAMCATPTTGCVNLSSVTCTVSVRCEEQEMTCGDVGGCVQRDVTPTTGDGGVVAPDAEACSPGATRACYPGPAGTQDVGVCHGGTQTCGTSGTWDPCAGAVTPSAEVCGNALDEDCNGALDNGCQVSCLPTPVAGCGLVNVEPGPRFSLGEVGATNAEPVQTPIAVRGNFDLDAYEVTVARFRRFWSAGHPAPGGPIRYPNGSAVTASGSLVEPSGSGMPPLAGCTWSAAAGTREAHPLNCVDWTTAQAFCAWDGGRLPTEAEWEWAARWRRGSGLPAPPRQYPWGPETPTGSMGGACDRAQFAGCTGEDGAPTRHAGSFAATGGIFDFAGNVAEWTADVYEPYADAGCWGGASRVNPLCQASGSDARTVRGGGYASAVAMLAVAARASQPLAYRDDALGFRCVRDR